MLCNINFADRQDQEDRMLISSIQKLNFDFEFRMLTGLMMILNSDYEGNKQIILIKKMK